MVWTAARVAEWERTGIRPPVAVWTAAQTAGFLNAIRGHRLYAAYHLIALRGLRRGEAAVLRWRDIDLDGATAIITCQLQQYEGRLVLCPPKTARSERAVALDRTTVAVLRAHEAAQEAERATLGKNYHDSGYVFTCLNGDPMAPDRLSRTSQPTPTRRCSPEVAHKAAEDVATLIIQAGCLVPGTTRPRQPEPPGYGGGGQGSGSRAHPGRQVSRPARADLDINRNRLSGNVPAQRRNAHMLLQMGSGHPAIPRPTSAHTDTLTREKIGVKPRVSTGEVFTFGVDLGGTGFGWRAAHRLSGR